MSPEPCTVRWASPVAPEDAPGLVALLDAHERERLSRFRRDADRARYLAAHALARLVLAEHVGAEPGAVEFDRTCRCGGQHGKPVVQAPGPRGAVPGFSLTHAADVVGVAVWTRGQVGLDVEHVRPLSDVAAMARHVASPVEPAHTTPSGFFTAWTRKEALLKATGIGLTAPMAAITVETGDDGPRLAGWSGEHAPPGPLWLRDLRPAAGYAAAIAGAGPVAPSVTELRADHLLRALAR